MSQSLVVGVSVLIHSTAQLLLVPETNPANCLLAIYLILPFISCSSALMYYNWYPSQVFVGDTYTYFAGMSFYARTKTKLSDMLVRYDTQCGRNLGSFNENSHVIFYSSVN